MTRSRSNLLIAGPNPTIDRVIDLANFEPGHIHRAERVAARIGGGGINAARTARGLGAEATLISVAPRGDRERLEEQLHAEGLSAKLVSCGGRLRMATIVREGGGRMSMLSEPGAPLDVREWESFARLVRDELSPGQVLLCTGSLPPGAPTDGYSRLAREARHAGSGCIVDSGGETLAATLEAGEGTVVPNLAEAEGVLIGRRLEPIDPDDAPERARSAANGLLRIGAQAAIVTAGAAGAAFASGGRRGGSGWIPAPKVNLVSPVGAGDAFATGLALRLQAGEALERAVRFAVAVAAAHVTSSDNPREPVGDQVGSASAVQR